MKSTVRYYIFLCLLLLFIPTLKAQELGHQRISEYDYELAFQQRRDSLINNYFNNDHWGFVQAAARFYRGEKIDEAISFVDSLVHRQEVRPSGDMFWMYPQVLITFTGDKYIPDHLKKRMRALWKNYHPYRGDTENHWAMWYTCMYLMSQYYPNEPGSEWFDGRSSTENFNEARDYLISWMDLTATKGQGEFNSPEYFGFYVAAMSELYTFAEDPAMKMRAKMMLDYLFADLAVDNFYGLDTGAHSREYPAPVVNQFLQRSTAFSWLQFGNNVKRYRGESFILALSGYHIPEIIYHIANDRSAPYIMEEVKRTRHRIRYSKVMDKPVYKYLYMCKDYSLGSIQGGLLQPIQQQTWDLTWATPDMKMDKEKSTNFSYSDLMSQNVKAKEGFNNLFTIQPHYSALELGMYFPEEPEMNIESVLQSKGTYNNPDKWTGGSPYERIYQQKSALIALYNIKKGAHYEHIDGHFPKTLEIDRKNKGWIFAHGGNTYIAYYPLAKYKWTEEQDGYRLRSHNLKNGAVVQVASASKFKSFDDFKKAVRALPLETKTKPLPYVKFTNLSGDQMEFEYGKTPILNGKKVDYQSWKLFDGPFLSADVGSKKLLMKYGDMRRLLDFNTLTIKNWIESDSAN